MDLTEPTFMEPTKAAPRPRLRGRLHQVALLVSLIGLVWLVHEAPTGRALVAAWIYGLASVLLYLTSSSYHVFAKSSRARRRMQRADHAMIFVLIAGSFTPTAILLLPDPWRWASLVAMWCGASAGIVLKLVALERFPRLGATLYIGLGWAATATFPVLARRPTTLALFAAGGVLYTVGAVLFALNRPRLSPRWFGYHEVWHTMGVAAGGLLYAANLGLVRAG